MQVKARLSSRELPTYIVYPFFPSDILAILAPFVLTQNPVLKASSAISLSIFPAFMYGILSLTFEKNLNAT